MAQFPELALNEVLRSGDPSQWVKEKGRQELLLSSISMMQNLEDKMLVFNPLLSELLFSHHRDWDH